MYIFREPESWNVLTGTSRSPGPEHVWYKWLNGTRNSETWFPKDKIPICGMIKWKQSERRGRKLGWAVSMWLFCDVLRPECQNYDGSIRKILHSRFESHTGVLGVWSHTKDFISGVWRHPTPKISTQKSPGVGLFPQRAWDRVRGWLWIAFTFVFAFAFAFAIAFVFAFGFCFCFCFYFYFCFCFCKLNFFFSSAPQRAFPWCGMAHLRQRREMSRVIH